MAEYMGQDAGRWVDEEVKSVKSSSDCNDCLSPVGSRSLAGSEGREEVLEVEER